MMTRSSAREKVGRNEPCPCGSGKKYKRCCLANDEGADLERAAAPVAAVARPVATASENARVAASVNKKLGVPGLTPYVVAKIAEDPRSAGDSPQLRALIERHVRERWTRAKVASMATDAIEAQLHRYGVTYARASFIDIARPRTSAWFIAEDWLQGDRVTCRGKDQDFLGLAACELWKRLLPDHPSIEMLDDRMQEGYDLVEQKRISDACDLWWNIWCTLRSRFSADMTTMEDASAVFVGTQSIFNWSQDLELHLSNAAFHDRRYAEIGRQYCHEWRAQFTDERASIQVNFGRSLASFLAELGEIDPAMRVLESLIERWPDDPWGYVALADACSHLFPSVPNPPLDLDKARRYLERGLAVAGHGPDRKTLVDRLGTVLQRLATPVAAAEP